MMDFRTFIRTLAAYWKLVAGALLACLVGAGFLTAFQTKSYQASATVLISFSNETDLSDVYYATEAAQERLSSYAQIAGGHVVAERAVNQLHVPMSADALESLTQVSFTPKSTLFTITVIDTDPTRVAALAGAMADQFAAMVPTLGTGPRPPPPGGPVPKPASQPPVAPPSDLDGQVVSPLSQTAATEQPPAPPQGLMPQTPDQRPLPVATATVVERPGVPDFPIKPVPMRNMALGLVAGVLLGIAAALTRQATDRTVHNRERMEQLSGLPTLAELTGGRGNTPRFGTDNSFDDTIRSFRTRLLKVVGPEARRVLLTSPFGGEGTTTTAVNLAISFTELGEKVLLVEGDPRQSVIAGLMGAKSGVSLTDVLVDRGIALEAAWATSVQNLCVLASRKARRTATLPRSTDLPDVLEDFSARFNRMVVDAAPVLATADTGMLAGAVQATVLVVRAGRTTFDEVNDALHSLRSAGADVVGTVLTDAKVSRHTRAAKRSYRAKLKGAA